MTPFHWIGNMFIWIGDAFVWKIERNISGEPDPYVWLEVAGFLVLWFSYIAVNFPSTKPKPEAPKEPERRRGIRKPQRTTPKPDLEREVKEFLARANHEAR